MTTLVVGMMFSPMKLNIIMLRKRKSSNPVISDLWNFPGGHVEPDEDPIDAVVREIREETGIETQASNWSHLATGTASNRDLTVLFYELTLSAQQWYSDWGTRTDETVVAMHVLEIAKNIVNSNSSPFVHNILMLIGLSFDYLANKPLAFRYTYPEKAFDPITYEILLVKDAQIVGKFYIQAAAKLGGGAFQWQNRLGQHLVAPYIAFPGGAQALNVTDIPDVDINDLDRRTIVIA